jgi:hypothetical protein
MGTPAGKAFNARLPEQLHRLIKLVAAEAASQQGGQTNMNKIIVLDLYHTYQERLSPEDRQAIEFFISRL